MPTTKTDHLSSDAHSTTGGRSQFHRSLPDSFQAGTEDVKSQCEDCLAAMNALCRSSSLLAETFVAVFQDTPFVELALRVKQLSQELAARMRNASEHIQVDGVDMVGKMLGRGSSPMEKSDEGVQVVARCFLLMLQTQCHFFRSATDAFSPLSRFAEVEDVLIGEECVGGIRDACSSWISASQATKSLRKVESLTASERQLLVEGDVHRGHQVNAKLSEVRQKVDDQALVYKQALVELHRTEFTLLGGFHLNLQCTSLVLHGCCPSKETNDPRSNQLLRYVMEPPPPATTGQSHRLTLDELRAALQTDLDDVSLQVEGSLCQRSPNREENFKSKLKAVVALVKECSKQSGLALSVDHVALSLLCEACPSVAEMQSKLAAEIVFTSSDVVEVRPSNVHGHLRRYAQISTQEGAFVVEVPSVWALSRCHRAPTDAEASLGVVEIVYLRRVELGEVLEGRTPSLPTIKLKLRRCEDSAPVPTPAPGRGGKPADKPPGDGSPSSPLGKGFRHTVEKLASKFGLVSGGLLAKSPNSEFYVDAGEVVDSVEQTNHEGHKVDDNAQLGLAVPVGSGIQPKVTVEDSCVTSTPHRPMMVSPTVTITTHPSPTEEQAPWTKSAVGFKGPTFINKKGFASDAEVQDIVDLLSGITRLPPSVVGHHPPFLDVYRSRTPQSLTPLSSPGSVRSTKGSSWRGASDPTSGKFGNFNPVFQETETRDKLGEIPVTAAVSGKWASMLPQQNAVNQLEPRPFPQQAVANRGNASNNATTTTASDSSNTDAEFAQYIATNFLGKRSKGYAKDLDMVGNLHQWGYPERCLSGTWPSPAEGNTEGVTDQVNHSFTGQHDSGSSSDDSTENGDSAFSMGLGLTGPNFVASVNRRRHSSGGEEVVHHGQSFDPSGPSGMKYLNVAHMLPKSTKTWPPKVIWQRAVSPSNAAVPMAPAPYPNPVILQDQLHVHPPLGLQWSDPGCLRQCPMWPPTGGGSSPVSPGGPPLGPAQSPRRMGPQNEAPSRGHPKLDRKYAYSHY